MVGCVTASPTFFEGFCDKIMRRDGWLLVTATAALYEAVGYVFIRHGLAMAQNFMCFRLHCGKKTRYNGLYLYFFYYFVTCQLIKKTK